MPRKKQCEMEWTDLTTARCECGHLMKNHTLIISKKVIRNKGQPVNGHCKRCSCKRLRLQ